MRAPDKEQGAEGNLRRAWRIPLPSTAPAALSQWLMYCPRIHPVWSYWLVSLVHLRDLAEAAKPLKTDPRNEYELAVYALDPEHEVDAERRETLRPLMPPDQVDQFYLHGDDQGATELVEAMVDAVVRGELAPDSDFRRSWRGAVMRAAYAAGKRRGKVMLR